MIAVEEEIREFSASLTKQRVLGEVQRYNGRPLYR